MVADAKMQCMGRKLQLDEYASADVLSLAQSFLGKYIVSVDEDGRVGGWIVETEAYGGIEDRACHAAGGRRTQRTEIMYRRGGVAYVYLCYGLHHMLNFVTGPEEMPFAVLIREIIIEEGETLVARRRKGIKRALWAKGPGCVTQALGITLADNGISLVGNRLWVEDRGIVVPEHEIHRTPRIGVDYAGKIWAKKPWRMIWKTITHK